MLQFRPEDVHFTSILENDFVVKLSQSFLCLRSVRVLDECFPYFCFFENEDFNNSSVRAEELIEIVVCDDIAKLIVDAYE